MKRLFLLPAILFALSLSATEYTVGAWRIALSDKGVANVYLNNNLILADNNAKFKVGNEEFLLSNLTNQTITDEALTDAFGTGRKITVTATINENTSFVQTYNLYENLNYILTQIELKSDNSLKSNYIAPINTTTATTSILPASENRSLFVPFDNDEWIRYKSNKFGSTITSYEVGLLYNVATNEGLVLGSLTHTDWKTGIKTSTESVNKVSSILVYAGASDNTTRDSLPHGYVCGKSVKSPLMMIGKFSDWRDAMETFGDLNTIVAPKLTWNSGKPFVWNSWGVLQTKISYMNATQSATYIADSIVPLGYQNDGTMYMNLDSYWDNMSYSDLKRFSYNCNQKGLKTGIYWTPFVDWANNADRQVEGTTDGTTYKDIWLYANGQPIKRTGACALDPTHPATKARAKLYIERFLAQGYEFVKLDFMLHGIQEADSWYDSTITTGVQAYNYGMRYIDSLTQGKMYINLSIAPIFPYHYAHGRRIACDAYSSISNSEYTLNSTTYGWWLDHMYTYNDADNVVFKDQQISVNRVRLTSSLITGMACIGDDYSLTGDDQAKEHAKKLLNNPELMQMARETKGFRPLVLPQNGDSAASQYYTVVEDTVFVAVFNFTSRRYNYTLSFSGLPLQAGKQYLVHELFHDLCGYITDSYPYSQPLEQQDAYIFKIYPIVMPDITHTTFEVRDLQDGTETCTSLLPNELAAGVMIYGDYDNDGDLDIFYIGGQNANNQKVGLLQNNNGVYSKVKLSEDFQSLQQASAAWIDYNNDGNLDLILTGSTDGSSTITMVMKNLGAADGYAFEEDMNNYIPGIYGENNDNTQHQIAVLDYNNDGWMDIALTGNTGAKWDGEHSRLTALFRNNNGVFEYDAIARKATIDTEVFDQINGGGIIVGDANNDGYMDILVTGYSDVALKTDGETAGNGVIYLYLNDGNGNFSNANITFNHAENQGVAFFLDVNNDGWNDIVEIGRDLNNGWANAASVWTNHNGVFSRLYNCGLTGGQANVSIGDINNDGFMDIAYAGWPTVAIAYGQGTGVFQEVAYKDATQGLSQLCARGGAVNMVDLNEDNTLDIQTSGWSDLYTGWRNGEAINKSTITNQPPTAPTNLALTATENGYKLTWNAGTDDLTPVKALRYNVIATTKDGKIFSIVPADLNTGKQKVAGGYITYLNTLFHEFNSKEFTTFYVQTIDGANAASTFASVKVSDAPTASDDVLAAPTAQKVIRNGQLLILKDGTYYTALGVMID